MHYHTCSYVMSGDHKNEIFLKRNSKEFLQSMLEKQMEYCKTEFY